MKENVKPAVYNAFTVTTPPLDNQPKGDSEAHSQSDRVLLTTVKSEQHRKKSQQKKPKKKNQESKCLHGKHSGPPIVKCDEGTNTDVRVVRRLSVIDIEKMLSSLASQFSLQINQDEETQ